MLPKVCRVCGKKLNEKNQVPTKRLCKKCNGARSRAWVESHPKEAKKYAADYYEANKEVIVKRAVDWQKENKDKKNHNGRTWRWRVRLRMIEAYGGKCSCCGETIPEFLTIDHINDDGYTKRKNGQGVGATLYKELERRGWPKDEYQLHCMNCNFAKGHFGICPHQRKR